MSSNASFNFFLHRNSWSYNRGGWVNGVILPDAPLQPACRGCGLDLTRDTGDRWAFFYLTTAGITGLFILAMVVFQPVRTTERRVLLAATAAAVILGTLPRRKALAFATEHLMARWTEPGPEPSECPSATSPVRDLTRRSDHT